METKVHFENIEKVLLEELSKTQSSIRLVVAWLTNKKLFAKLVELAEKGIVVNVIINNDEINRDSLLDYSRLNIGDSFIKMLETKNGNILHHKFCIIDENIVINGSYNWTYKANYNKENIHINTDTNLAKQHSIEFVNILSKTNDYNRVSYKNENLQSTINIADDNKNNSYAKELELRDKKQWEQFENWKNNQDIYDIKFNDYLHHYLAQQEYNVRLGIHDNSLEIELFALINFIQNSADFTKHTSFTKFIFYNIFNAFRNNITRFDYKILPYFDYNGVCIGPYFNDKIKDIIYQDRFTKSTNAYSYKIGLTLIMLDFAYSDYTYNGLLSPNVGFMDLLEDYTKEPKVFSANIVEVLKFLKDLKKDNLNLKEKDGLLHINNCIRYFSNGCHRDFEIEPITVHYENEWPAFGVHLKSIGVQKKDCIIETSEYNELVNNYLSAENEFEDVILKISLEKFNKIIYELEKNGLKNSFTLARTITEIHLNVDNLDFITDENELKLLIQDFVAQKVIIKDVTHEAEENSYKISTLQWSFEKTKADIKKESLMIDYLWEYNNFESKYDLWDALEKEKAENRSYEFYLNTYSLLKYLNNLNIDLVDFIKEDEKYKNTIKEIAAKTVQIPEFLPNGFNILRLFNSLKVNTASMPINKDIIIPKEIKKGKVLDEIFRNEFNGERANIQINESVKPFIWLENGENIRVNKNAKRCKNTGQFLLFGKDYIFRQSSLVLGNPQNVLLKDDSKTDEMPNYEEIEKENQIKHNSNLP